MNMNFMTVALSDIGIKKKTNQDSVLLKVANTDLGKVAFCVICDGMGGLAKGELASATLIRQFSNWFSNELPALLYRGIDENKLKNEWESIIFSQNQRIMEFGKNTGVNLGTTVTALLLFNSSYYSINVGDTRAYAISNSLQQITKDQTLVAREVELGNLTYEQAQLDPRRNVLLQCVGASTTIVPDFFFEKFNSGTVFMLCSDGFRHQISEEEIWGKFNPSILNDENTMRLNAFNLIEVNKARLENDNISVALIKAY